VVFSEADNAYYYAMATTQGRAVIKSRVLASLRPPPGLEKHLEDPDAIVSAIRAANISKYAPDRAARWAQRKDAVISQRSSDMSTPSTDVKSLAVSGSRVGLMILVQFPDDPATPLFDPINFPTTPAKMVRYSNEIGYTDDGNTGSIREYFLDQSLGALDFTQIVSAVVTLPHPRNYYNYANYPTNTAFLDAGTSGRRLVADAVEELKLLDFDFSGLTVDGFNRVLATSLMFAGNLSGVWSQGLWPHSWTLGGYNNVGTPGNPRYLYFYQVTNVLNSAPVIGTMCHELGHLVLDYPDFYDTDSSDGASQGIGEHSLMGSGNYLNGGRTPAPIDLYLKDFSGWASITDLSLNVASQGSLTAGGYGYRIRKPGSAGEYFLLENRSDEDRWANHAPDKGLMIWHVDEAVTTDNMRQQMTAFKHYELSLEQADGLFDLESNRDRGDSQDLFDSFALFSGSTLPESDWWDGTASAIRIQVLNPPGAPNLYLQFFSDVVQVPIANALDTTDSVWSEDGRMFAPGSWYGALSATAYDGVDAATHYPIADSQQASVSTEVTGPGSLTFRWKVSSELNGDYLSFYRDDMQLPTVVQISGEVDWQQRTVSIPAGPHTLRWTYAKNASLSADEDSAWLDQVVFTPGPVDTDGDGLTDNEELVLGTNPDSVDSDGDGLVDGAGGQVLLSSYPGGIDSDEDGFVDGEGDMGTDPNASNTGDLAPRGSPDNQINTGDLVMMSRFVDGLSQPSAVEAALGDIDGDGDLDIGDLVLLQNWLRVGTPP
jgi:M6 family metalloprotease-like protein